LGSTPADCMLMDFFLMQTIQGSMSLSSENLGYMLSPEGPHHGPIQSSNHPRLAISTKSQDIQSFLGFVSHLFPNAKSHLVLVFRPHHRHLTKPSQDFPDLISPTDWSRSYPTGSSGHHPSHPSHRQNSSCVATHNIGDVAAFKIIVVTVTIMQHA